MSLPPNVENILDNAIEWIYSFQPLVEPTVVLVPQVLRDGVESLSEAVGFDVPTLNITLALLMCYPLGFVMNFIPRGTSRHAASLLFGAFLLQFVVGVQWIHQLITSLVAYAMFALLPRSTSKWLVPTFVMAYCVLGHLHRQYINYLGWDLDFTGSQMVLTQKLYMMAFNLYDAQQLASDKPSRAATKCSRFAVPNLPGLLPYLGYTFCFSSILSGPAFEYTTYLRAIEGTHLYDSKTGKPLSKSGSIPSNIWPTLKPFLLSVLNLVIFVVVGGAFPLLDPTDPQKNTPVILTSEFLLKPWPYRYMYQWLGLVAIRQKYYFAWTNAEGAHNIWYAGFDGYDADGNERGWDTASNADIWGFETAPTVQALSKDWNKKTSVWLSRYVYMRTNGSLFAVYSTSAFWHGFYPGYYFFFLSVPLITFCSRLASKKISPYFSESQLKNKWSPYGTVCILTTSFFVEYLIIGFVVLSAERSWAAYKAHYFMGHLIPLAFYMALMIMPSPKKKGEDAKKKAA